MKVCFINDSLFGLGGAQRCTTILVNNLIAEGYDVSVLSTNTMYKENYNLYNLNKNVKIKYFETNNKFKKILLFWTKILEKINNNTNLLKNKFKLLKYIYYYKNKNMISKIENYINREKFDCIIGVSSYYSVLVSLLNLNYNPKRVGWQHSSTERYFNLKGKFLWHQDAIVKNMFRKLDDYVVLTDIDKKELKKVYNVDACRIYNPCSFKTNEKSELKNKTFLAVGRLDKVKGFDKLIEAFHYFSLKNNDWVLKIYGSGPEKENLEELIKKYNLENKIILKPTTENIIKVYIDSSILILSSRREGLPMVFLEAMECGLPVITFDLPCAREVFGTDGAIIVEYQNSKKLSEAMLDLVSDETKMKLMSKIGIKQVKNYYIEKIIKEWLNVIGDKNENNKKKNKI